MAMPKQILRKRSTESMRQRSRSGLTLIEMMVSIALTLIVVLAVIRLFDMVGGTVSDSRTILELSAQLRNVAQQLQHDLDRATTTMLPPVDPDSAGGFFEIIEGPDTDYDPQFGIWFDEQANLGRSVRNPAFPDPNNLNGTLENHPLGFAGHRFDASGRYGDLDDVLMFAIHSDGEPFVGKVDPSWAGTDTIRSEYAVVIWWVEPYNDVNGQPRALRLHRRQLLVVQDPNISNLLIADRVTSSINFNANTNDVNSARNNFQARNDIAVYVPTGATGLRTASLVDLADRRKRYAHDLNSVLSGLGTFGTFYHPCDRGITDKKQLGDTSPLTIYPLGLNANPIDRALANRVGQDVVLSDVLAFDVKVYSANAPILQAGVAPAVTTLLPHDIGYQQLLQASPGLAAPANVTMRGAFVDLYYGRNLPSGIVWQDPFAFAPHFNSRVFLPGSPDPLTVSYRINQSAVYDTWSTGYERDGIDQDADGLVDEGIDGLDGDNDSGGDKFFQTPGIVDDIGEKETTAPYPQPLRGIEVTIRVIQPGGSEQIRQTSVVANFKHE
ncbi:MAG: prepilin-type N-terminal cleavage/methylation domain-containing protein [Planctomycetales bacterium]|nr:prepilin-type N-terminal cleavage/methylation domain-containing protein [Planctomycetales bacterium]